MVNSNQIKKMGILYIHIVGQLIIREGQLSRTTYYQRNRDVILNRAKEHYKNDKEKLIQKARDNYRTLSEEVKKKKTKYEKKIDIIICLKKRNKN